MTVTIIQNNTTTTVADGSSIFISGSGDTLITDDSTITVGDNSELSVNGNNNQLTLGSGTSLDLSGGQGDSVTDIGTGDTVVNAASLTLTGNGSSVNVISAVDVGSGGTATLAGQFETLTFIDNGGGTVTTEGNGDSLILDTTGRDTVIADVPGGEVGSGITTISMTGLGGEADITGFDNNIVTMENDRETVIFSGGANGVTIDAGATLGRDIVKATGGAVVSVTVSTGGDGEVDADNGSVALNDNARATVNGSNDDIFVASGATLAVNGTNDDVRVGGVNNMITASNTAVALFSGDSAIVIGGGDSVTLNDNGTLLMSGDGNTIAVNDVHDTVNLFGTGNTITTTSAASIALHHDGATATVNGDGNSFTFEGNAQTVNLNGNGNAVDVVDSAGDTVNSTGATAVTLEVGANANVNANGSTILIFDNTTVSVVGSNDQISNQGSGSGTVRLNGTGDVLADSFFGGGQMQLTNGSPSNAGPTNELNLGIGANDTVVVADKNLWFQASGNDLRIELLGSQDEVTVANWFASPGDQLQAIHAGGMTLDNGAVSQLVQAMATFANATPGFDPTSATGAAQAHADPGVQAAIVAAWHG